jgi:ankyrin repeat protein
MLSMGIISEFDNYLSQRDFVAAESLVMDAYSKDDSLFTEFLNDEEENPLVSAVRGGALQVVRRLINCGADVCFRPTDGFRPVDVAIFAALEHPAGLACLAYLLKSGADPNLPGSAGIRPIHRAVIEENFAAFQLLIAYGADPFLLDDDRYPDSAYLRITKRKLAHFMETLRDAGKIVNGSPVEY